MVISIIAAVAKNWVIGNKNSLPWHLPADFKYFKEKTVGKTIVLGLNTFKSIGEKPLPNRKHIILSKQPMENLPDDCSWAASVQEVLEMAKNEEELMVCGGASVYQQFLPLADRLYLTFIHQSFEGDTFFPEFNKNEWQEMWRQDNKSDEKNPYPYSFVIFERKMESR